MSTTKTITFKGVDLKVNFTYTEADPGVMYHSDMSGTPPSPPEAEIHEVYIDKIDVYDLLEDQLDEVELAIIEAVENER